MDRHNLKLPVEVNISAVTNQRACFVVLTNKRAYYTGKLKIVNILPVPTELVFTVVANKPSGTDVGRADFPVIHSALMSCSVLGDLVKYDYMFSPPSS